MTDDGPALLVVDDNADNVYMLTRRLKREGYSNLMVAENGRQAVDMLAGQRFDLVLLDIIMPEMDGYQVLEHIKSSQELRDIPVIMISAVDELDSVVRCIELGAEDYLPKPFNPVLLRARIGACLEKKRLREQAAAYRSKIERERRRAEARMLEITGAISSELLLDELLKKIIAAASEIRNAERSSLF